MYRRLEPSLLTYRSSKPSLLKSANTAPSPTEPALVTPRAAAWSVKCPVPSLIHSWAAPSWFGRYRSTEPSPLTSAHAAPDTNLEHMPMGRFVSIPTAEVTSWNRGVATRGGSTSNCMEASTRFPTHASIRNDPCSLNHMAVVTVHWLCSK